MKILLTGGLGFIGRNFLLHRPKEWQVTSFDVIEDKNLPASKAGFQKLVKNTQFFKVDLTSEKQVKKIARKIGPNFDVCLHLAANGDPALSVPDPLWDLRATTTTLINVGQHFSIKKIIYFSSGAVYDGKLGLVSPMTPVSPILPYAISHFASEQYVRFFQTSGKIKEYVIIRFFGAYGPHEPPRKIYTRLVRAFGVEGKSEFTIRGDGKNFIDAMFVEDAISALTRVIQSKNTNLIIDLCSGRRTKINVLVEQAAKIFGRKVKILHQGQVPEYIEFYASSVRFQKLFGFRPKVSLEEGLGKLYKFIKKIDKKKQG